jgi:hypothetical protein
MNCWNKQLVDAEARAGQTRGERQHRPNVWKGRQSFPRMRLRWSHSQGAAEDSLSNMYKCDMVIHNFAKKIRCTCANNLFLFPAD